jgi:O-antigen ligase
MKNKSEHSAEKWSYVLIIQIFILNAFASWSLGGGSYGAKWLIGMIGWTTLITLGFRYRWVLSLRALRNFRLWGLFVIYILISIWNPQAEVVGGFLGGHYRFIDYIEYLPSAVLVRDTWEYLVMYSGIGMAAVAAYYSIGHRREWILLMRLLFMNYAVLVLVGFIFKAIDTDKVLGFSEWLGPKTFFASFRYHNNWAAYALIGICIGLGLLYNEVQKGGKVFGRGSNGMLYFSVIFFLAVSIPLVGSRSGTSFLLIVLAYVLIKWIVFVKNVSAFGRFFRVLTAGTLLTAGVSSAYMLGEESIHRSIAKSMQLAGRVEQGKPADLRVLIWEETIRVGMKKPWLGRGWGSYKRVFINETHLYFRYLKPSMGRGMSWYAHNDWLQHWFELGVIGFILLLSVPIGLIRHAYRNGRKNPFSSWIILACIITLLYALVDLPFASPPILTIFSIAFVCAAKYSIIEKLAERERKGS